MKKLSIAFILFTGACLFSACNGNNSKTESSTTSDSMVNNSNVMDTSATGSKMDTMNNKMDTMKSNTGTAMVDQKAKDFVKDAATGGMMEVELGKMAEGKGKSQQVKDFGKMMVDDHSKANDELKNIATKKNIDVPPSLTDDQRKDVDKLSKKTGADFDKAYVDMMVEDHKKDVAAFKKASGNLNDNDLKTFATTTLPTLQKHLDAIQGIKSKM
ncbi:MAG: DUF4142 domain-containing protein [Bacteroidota bacterium]|nr:DUF4142 domain-containing protein [Bacteroidota bacterium]